MSNGTTVTPEAQPSQSVGQDENWFANVKRLFDEFLNESLTDIRDRRILFNKMMSDAMQYDNQRQGIANQSLQNAVENANLMSKTVIPNLGVGLISTEAIGAAVAAAVATVLNKTSGTKVA